MNATTETNPNVKVLDCTLRDGGLVNNFFFNDSFVKELYLSNIKSGVDYMEFGYKASKSLFNIDKFGKWKFCDDEDIIKIVGDKYSNMKISVMADVGRTDFKKDIINKKDSAVDLIRIATYTNTLPDAIKMIEYCKNKGYETSVNLMSVSNVNKYTLKEALNLLGKSPVDMIYIVDSYGSLYPEQIETLSKIYLEYAYKYNKHIGIHTHNNLQLAFANTITAISLGVDYIDATVNSLGRGAGNCPLELILGFLKNPKYDITPMLSFIEQHMVKIKNSGLQWGYDIPYILSGILNKHPSSAIQFLKEDRKNYSVFYEELKKEV